MCFACNFGSASHSASWGSLTQVYERICRGTFCLPEAQRRELIVREAPLKELKGIVTCTGIEKSYFVVTGEQAVSTDEEHPYRLLFY